MGYDLTNQNISDTFQNLLQKTGSGNQLYDLRGNEIGDLTIAGALHAQSYVVSESTVAVSSGSTVFGDSHDDTHTFIGSLNNITASGNISGSSTTDLTLGGNVTLNNFRYLHFDGGEGNTNIVNLNGSLTLDANSSLYLRPDEDVHIVQGVTAWSKFVGDDRQFIVTGDISASGFIFLKETGSSFQGTDGTGAGYLFASSSGQLCYQSGSTVESVIALGTGGGGVSFPTTEVISSSAHIHTLSHITASGNISASGNGTHYFGGGIKFRDNLTGIYNTTERSSTIFVPTSTGFTMGSMVGADPQDRITINSTNIKLNAPVTASSHISASGNISTTGEITTTGGLFLSGTGAGYHLSASQGNLELSGSGTAELNVEGDIIASGDISGSGHLYLESSKEIIWGTSTSDPWIRGSTGNTLSLDSDDFLFMYADTRAVIDSPLVGIGGHYLTNNPPKTLTVEGDISASGELYANNKLIVSSSGDVMAGYHGNQTRIKILPRDFIGDDGGRPIMIDDTSSDRWMKSFSTFTVYASVDIPTGFTATHVHIYGDGTSAMTVYEADINSATVTSRGTGNIETELDITDVVSDTTNYLLIELVQTSAEKVYGGYVTIIKS